MMSKAPGSPHDRQILKAEEQVPLIVPDPPLYNYVLAEPVHRGRKIPCHPRLDELDGRW